MRDFIKRIKAGVKDAGRTVKGAGETVRDYAHVAKNFAKRQDMQADLAKKKKAKWIYDYRSKAQDEFRKNFGRSYNPADESRKDNIAYRKLIEKYKSQ